MGGGFDGETGRKGATVVPRNRWEDNITAGLI
jgi:hypothetical protein